MDAVIFDMDGVLVDSERYWHQWQPVLFGDALPDDADPETVMHDLTGMNYQEMYDHLATTYTLNMDKKEWVDAFNQQAATIYRDKVQLMDDAPDILAAIREHDVKTAIASSSPRKWIEQVLDRFALHDLFDATVSAEEIPGDGKPAPAIYQYTADQLAVDPSRCVVVEDSRNGVTAAKAAGMTCIGFRTTHNQDTDLSAADTTVTSPEALRDALTARFP